MRDDEIQDALDRQARAAEPPSPDTADAAGADRAAYAIVYAALAEDTGFALPAAFAESIAAAAMPEPARPSIFERAILPVLLLISAAIGVPAAVPQLTRAFRLLLGTPDGGIPAAAIAALVLLLIAVADRLARRSGWAPRT
jgi:hypothetical protein